ncbi:MAG: hypothetical protein ACRYFS_05935 [Janthinobacterium lividum]
MMAQKLLSALFIVVATLFIIHLGVFADETPTDNLQKQVDTAVVAARQNDLGPTLHLKNKGALPYFEKYATDPNQIVRIGVIEIAAADHTGEGVKVLTPLVSDPSVGVQATDALYENYDKLLIKQAGGKILKTGLLSAVKTRPYGFSGQVILLLTCFPNDAEVLAVLKNLEPMADSAATNSQTLSAKQAIPVDLALSEIGDASASRRVQAVIQKGDIDLLPVLFDDLKFVDNPAVWASLVPLLHDTRDTKAGILISWGLSVFPAPGKDGISKFPILPPSSVSKPRPLYFRVCDLALVRLARKTGIDVGIPDLMTGINPHNSIPEPRHYTDAELKLAYSRLSAYFQGGGK